MVERFWIAATFSNVTAGAGDSNATIEALMATTFTGSTDLDAAATTVRGAGVACLAATGIAARSASLLPKTTKEREIFSVGGATWTKDDAHAPVVVQTPNANAPHAIRKPGPQPLTTQCPQPMRSPGDHAGRPVIKCLRNGQHVG
jgi:hypothetical protein